DAMRRLYRATGGDQALAGGESGAASTGALIALMTDPRFAGAKEWLGLRPSPRVLGLATQRAGGPAPLASIVGAKPCLASPDWSVSPCCTAGYSTPRRSRSAGIRSTW